MNQKLGLKAASWASIIDAATLIPRNIGIYRILALFGVITQQIVSPIFYVTPIMINFIVLISVLNGYLIIARENKLKNFSKYLYISIISSVAAFILSEIAGFTGNNIMETIAVTATIISGVALIMFGNQMFRLKNKFKNLATAIGTSYMMIGLLFATYFLSNLATFIGVVLATFEAVLFFKAAKMK
ncbi:MAG: hypothetical protein ACLFPQ_05285 [Candidatus Woesearchaeota archaeon]